MFQSSSSCLPLVQWALGTVGRVPTDGQVDSGATLTGPRERESTIAGPGPSSQPPHQNYRLDAVKLMTLYTFHIMDFSFLLPLPPSMHTHFLHLFFVYRAFVYQLFLSLCKEYGKKLVDTQSQARLSDVLSKNNLMSSHADIQTVKSICCLLPMIQ